MRLDGRSGGVPPLREGGMTLAFLLFRRKRQKRVAVMKESSMAHTSRLRKMEERRMRNEGMGPGM